MADARKTIEQAFHTRYWAVQHRYVSQALQAKTIEVLVRAEQALKQAKRLAAKNSKTGQDGSIS